MNAARWDGDTRGSGAGDAAIVPGSSQLVAVFGEHAWVAEQPEIHLRPHVEAWCERDRRLAISNAYSDDRNAYVLELDWRGAPAGVGEGRATIFSLIGSFAESATHVRQRGVTSDADGSTQKIAVRGRHG